MLYKFANDSIIIICILILTISVSILVDLSPLPFALPQSIFKNVNAFIEKGIALGQANTNETINHSNKALFSDLMNNTCCQNLYNNGTTTLNMYNDTSTSFPSKQNTKALRLTFSYEGNNIQLISQQKIEKVLPPSDNIQQNQTGFWYELTDSENNTVYRQIMNSPIKIDMEVFSNDPKESIIRQQITDIRGIFSIVVPDIPQAKNFDMFSSPIVSEGIAGIQKPATKIFHLNLNEG
jgi:hypothetical protein